MPEQIKTYQLSDIPAGDADSASLRDAINADAVVTIHCSNVHKQGTGLHVHFLDTISAAMEDALQGAGWAGDGNALGGILGDHTAVPVELPDEVELANVKTDHAKQLVVANALGTDGGERTITHNFCDATTWWHESTEHTAQPTTSGDSLVYDVTDHALLIDVRHGKITFEDDLTVATVGPNGNTMTSLLPTVLLDGVALDQALEDAAAGDDRYTIDYKLGTVTFAVARTGEVVTVAFRKSGSSKFTIKPKAGHKFVLNDAEVDCSEDIDMDAKFMVDTHGSHSTLTGGAVVSLSKRIYKKMHDFQSAARRFWGPIPAGFGGTGGIASPKWTFEWQYSRSDALYDTPSYRDVNEDEAATFITLNKVEVSINGDVAYGGCCLTVTMYGYQEHEAD